MDKIHRTCPSVADNAKFVMKRLAALNCCITGGFQRGEIIGVNSIAKIGVIPHASRLEPKDDLKLRCPGGFACAQNSLPDPNACPMVGNPESICTFVQRIVD